MNGWISVPLSELLEIPIRNGLTKPKAIRGEGVKMIGMGELFSCDRISDVEMDRVPVTEKELSTSSILEGDLLFARQSLVLEGAGKCCIVTEVNEDTVFESHLIRVRIDRNKALPEFVYYYFNSHSGKENVKTIVEQVAAAGIRGKDLIKLNIPCPPIEIQKKIVNILKPLEDKMDLDKMICEKLERQFKVIYESRFSTRMSAEWKDVPLQEVMFFQEGPGIRNWQYVDEDGVKFINIRCINNGDINTETANMISEEEANGKYSHFLLEENDIVMSCSGTLGRYAIVRKEHLPLCLNTSVIRFRPLQGDTDFEYVLGYLTSQEFLMAQQALACGSVQSNFGPTHLKKMTIKLPPEDERVAFHHDVKSTIKMMIQKRSEIQILAKYYKMTLDQLVEEKIQL